jgi:ATP-dependent Clp protease ATP-binding subunit ClpA
VLPYGLAVLEGYSDAARRVVGIATAEAGELGHPHVGTEHLLLGLLSGEAGGVADRLHGVGATMTAARHMVVEVTGTPVASPAGELPFSPRAQRALERAARFSRQDRGQRVEVEHVLLGVLDVEGLACQVLRRLGVDVGQLRDARTGSAGAEVEEAGAAAPIDVPLRCPTCGVDMDGHLAERTLQTDAARPVSVIHCTECATLLGVVRS